MKTILIKSQAAFEKIQRIEADEEVICETAVRFVGQIEILGRIVFKMVVDCSHYARRNLMVPANSSPSIEALANSSPSIEAWANSSPSIDAWENSSPSIVARANSSPRIVAWENSSPSIVAWENSSPSIVAWENSSPSIVAWANSSPSIEALANSSPRIVALANSSPRIVAWANSSIQGTSITSLNTKVSLFGYSVISLLEDLKIKVKKTKTAHIQRVKPIDDWFERNGVHKKKKVVLYKCVSSDFKTQESCPNETLWAVGSTVEHKNWNPSESECGEGKFHAVSRPYFGDEFRDNIGDRYIAIEISLPDLYEWKNPQYPHKIGFRKGKVLYECDRFGDKVMP